VHLGLDASFDTLRNQEFTFEDADPGLNTQGEVEERLGEQRETHVT
jgi:hypothetical protein